MRKLTKEIKHCEDCLAHRLVPHGKGLALYCALDDASHIVVRRAYDFEDHVMTNPPKSCRLPEAPSEVEGTTTNIHSTDQARFEWLMKAVNAPRHVIDARMREEEVKNHLDYPNWLLQRTFVVQYNPNCPSPFLVRLIRPGGGHLDLKPYISTHTKDEPKSDLTKDCLGFGLTLQEAAEEALKTQEGHKKPRNN
jgi:hypothetical protein